MSGKLYICPTPIGNLEDMTYRAVRILGEVDAIAAEDTRHTGILLKHFDIKKPLISYHEHNKEEKGTYIIELLLEGQSIACVSDAGMPAISDPGADLVTKAIKEGNISYVKTLLSNAEKVNRYGLIKEVLVKEVIKVDKDSEFETDYAVFMI